MTREHARESVEIVAARVASVPARVAELLAAPPSLSPLRGEVVVAGIGAAAAPARHLASLLAPVPGVCARHVPVSSFASGAPSRGRTLVLFSQHLSPNARLVLGRAADAARIVVVGSTTADEVRAAGAPPHVEIVTLPPEDERGMLLRIAGPAIATAAALLLAIDAGLEVDPAALARVPALLSRAGEAARAAATDETFEALLAGPTGIVTFGDAACSGRALAWKLLEAWSVPEPPTWDVLEVAHGPFQQLHRGPASLVALLPGEPRVVGLRDRLATMLVPGRHRLVTLASELPWPLSALEHDQLGSELVLRGLRARPRDLRTWDGQGLDRPLYDVDGTALSER